MQYMTKAGDVRLVSDGLVDWHEKQGWEAVSDKEAEKVTEEQASPNPTAEPAADSEPKKTTTARKGTSK